MSTTQRQQAVFNKMADNELMILYSGVQHHISVDAYHPFAVNTQFYYLTGIERKDVIFVMHKGEDFDPVLFIKRIDPLEEKWMGKQLTVDQAKEISGIQNIKYLDEFDKFITTLMMQQSVSTVYFDLYRHTPTDLPDYNHVKAEEFKNRYSFVQLKNAYPLIAELRMQKDKEEIAKVQKAIDITKSGLEYVLQTLKPGMYENQVQANFEYMIRYNGASGPSFNTIAGAGYNGTMLHYTENNSPCNDNELILLDLGAKYDGYCADITRTYPINGKYTARQKEIYDIVLLANRTILKEAKPGMTTVDLNNICKRVLADGLKRIGLIKEDSELIKYYMHGVSHHLGIDVHDATIASNRKLRPGAIISDEPGLYIEEENIGIRIEDDLLITENGCVCLSQDIIRTTEEIEEYMAKNNK